VVSTTNRTLSEMVKEGKFRADLFYRLNVIPLTLPPLRERREDIGELAEHFLRLYTPRGRSLRLAPEFIERLGAHDWPGNVRELANCLRRAVALATGAEIGREGLEGSVWDNEKEKDVKRIAANGTDKNTDTDKDQEKDKSKDETGHEKLLRAGVSLGDMERRLVEMTLEATGGNRSRAAALLGVSLRTVRNKIRNYGLPSWSSYVHD